MKPEPAKKATSKYTPELVAMIYAAATPENPLTVERCAELAAKPEFVKAGITARGIAAKVRSLGNVPYKKVERVTKSGEPIAKKDEIVEQIEAVLGIDKLDSLAKAEKPALRRLLEAITEAAEVRAAS